MTAPLLIGIDLGTTKIVALAVESAHGQVVAQAARDNRARYTAAGASAPGRSEWDADGIVHTGVECLADVARQLGAASRDVRGIGVTGQQHGMLLVNAAGRSASPLINWQDRRGLEPMPGDGRNWVEVAQDRIGRDAVQRLGCRLQPGFLAVTLFWLQRSGGVPAGSRACFLMDYFAAQLTGAPIHTDPTCAASAGILNVRQRDWDAEALAGLGLSRDVLPHLAEADQAMGCLRPDVASDLGFAPDTCVFVPIGDHQASFVGSVADAENLALLNVGTGAQVAVFTSDEDFRPPVELRPYPLRGNLLSHVGLSGGWSYQILEQFLEDVGQRVFGIGSTAGQLYAAMNRLAAEVPAGSDGLLCQPCFAGTRANAAARGTIRGLSPQNFTVAHLARATLEGMANDYREAYQQLSTMCGRRHAQMAVAGNGLRANDVLAQIVVETVGIPLAVTRHQEAAAFGAALVASVGTGIHQNLAKAGQWVR
ncbi:MAG: sedoheptulokinase, partial [Pirellulaceae bacterium]